MLDGHPLGGAGGAGGEQHIGQVGVDGLLPQRLQQKAVRRSCQRLVQVHHRAGKAQGVGGIPVGAVGHQQGGGELAGDPPHPVGGLGGVQHGVEAAGGQRAQHGQQTGNFVVKVDRHRAALYAVAGQRRADALHRVPHLVPGQGAVLVAEGRAAAPAPDRVVQQLQNMFHGKDPLVVIRIIQDSPEEGPEL